MSSIQKWKYKLQWACSKVGRGAAFVDLRKPHCIVANEKKETHSYHRSSTIIHTAASGVTKFRPNVVGQPTVLTS